LSWRAPGGIIGRGGPPGTGVGEAEGGAHAGLAVRAPVPRAGRRLRAFHAGFLLPVP